MSFKNPKIPSEWSAESGVPQWADISPDLTLPNGYSYVKPPNKDTWSLAKAMQKGVTHWSRHWAAKEGLELEYRANNATKDKEYNDVPRIRELFGLSHNGPDNWDKGYNSAYWPNGPYSEQQAKEIGLRANVGPSLWVGETMEGDDYISEGHPMWKGYNEGVRQAYEQKGKPFKFCFNYYPRWGNYTGSNAYKLGEASIGEHERLYSVPVSQWPTTLFSPGQSLHATNLALADIYINNVDNAAEYIFKAIHFMELQKKMGRYTGLTIFGVHEWMPGFASQIELPNGAIFERSDKKPIDPSLLMLLPWINYEWGDTFVEWGLPIKAPADKTKLLDISFHAPGKDRYYLNGNRSEYPNYVQHGKGDYYVLNQFSGDLTHFSILDWNTQAAAFRNIPAQYLTYRVDGGQWVERKQNGSDIVRAWYEKKRIVRGRFDQTNKRALIYTFDLFADNRKHKLEVQNPTNPSQIFSGTVAGNGLQHLTINF